QKRLKSKHFLRISPYLLICAQIRVARSSSRLPAGFPPRSHGSPSERTSSRLRPAPVHSDACPKRSQFSGISPYLIICAHFFRRHTPLPNTSPSCKDAPEHLPPFVRGGQEGVTWSRFATCTSCSWKARHVGEGVGAACGVSLANASGDQI